MIHKYYINFEYLVKENTPQILNNCKGYVKWLIILILPLIKVHVKLIQVIEKIVYDLPFTGQVCSLERLLNNKYDYTLRRIFIEDALLHTPIYLYTDVEGTVIDLYTDNENAAVTIFTDGEIAGQASNHFIIYVPIGLSFDSFEMRKLVLQKRLLGKKFKIQTY